MPTTDSGIFSTPLEIRTVPGKGRGIFAARDLAEGEILEEAPVLLFSSDDAERLEATALGNHYFHWEGDEEDAGWRGALALGFVIPLMFVLGAIFALLWGTAYFLGRKIERERAAAYAAYRAEQQQG